MGFRRSYEDATGTTHSEAYYKVREVCLLWHDKTARIDVDIFHSQTARTNGKGAVERFQCAIGSDGYDAVFGTTALDAANMNPVKAAYGFVKVQLDDETIVDC